MLDERIRELKAREGSEGLQVTVVERARPASKPAKPDVPSRAGDGRRPGVALGAIAAYWRETLRQRRRPEPEGPVVTVARIHARRSGRTRRRAPGILRTDGLSPQATKLALAPPPPQRRLARGGRPRVEDLEAVRLSAAD